MKTATVEMELGTDAPPAPRVEPSMVELEEVTHEYGDAQTVVALRSVSLRVERGERLAVMGPSGSGKSTLLHLICGLDTATSGAVRFQGVEMSSLDDDARTRLRREKIGMVFQAFNLLPTLTALENVSLPLRLRGDGVRDAARVAAGLLERVGLSGRGRHRPDEMSGGERQRVALARALVFGPPLLLADEPTGSLDSATGEEVLALLDELHGELDMTIILVTHNARAAAHCDRVITLSDGRIVRDEGRRRPV